ncbi:hypothetical protein chiPu_0013072 [Chiloscyllium punctatum]|uniref:Uncharacterized protein n=1 Tax=Chiloscyllium punctatum TaxID=137246 RepID=A0A401SW19_CHIPU|nr:hypothetical protein [Chiloscyllium punctatum]
MESRMFVTVRARRRGAACSFRLKGDGRNVETQSRGKHKEVKYWSEISGQGAADTGRHEDIHGPFKHQPEIDSVTT